MDRRKVHFLQLALLLLIVLGWEFSVRLGWVDAFFFSKPSDIAVRIFEWFKSGEVYRHLWITLAETVLAFVSGTLAGVALGLWLALSPVASAVLDPFLKALNSVPRVILAPIFTLWFGLGMASKVALGFTLVFFVAFFNTYQGIREVSPVVLANARMLGASKNQLLRHVYLPSATSWILSSLRTSVGFAVIGAVVGEYLGASAGLGYVISQAEGVFDTTSVFAGIVVLAVFVVLLDVAVSVVERKLLVWRPAPGQEGGTV
ncbi:ABC transporter permease [Oceanithermus sp.]